MAFASPEKSPKMKFSLTPIGFDGFVYPETRWSGCSTLIRARKQAAEDSVKWVQLIKSVLIEGPGVRESWTNGEKVYDKAWY